MVAVTPTTNAAKKHKAAQGGLGCFRDCILSIRTFILMANTSQILVVCLAIWLASFLLGRESSNYTSAKLVDETVKRVSEFMDAKLQILKHGTFLIQKEWEITTSAKESDNKWWRSMLWKYISVFDLHLVSVALSPPKQYKYGYEAFDPLAETTSYEYREQWNGTAQISYNVNNVTGQVLEDSITTVEPNYKITSKAWYKTSIAADPKIGAWGDVYMTASSGTLTTFFGVPLMNRTNPTQKIGIVKNNMSLNLISNFMAQLNMLYKGFAIIVEPNGLFIGTSASSELTLKRDDRNSIFDVKEKGIAEIGAMLNETLGGTFKVSEKQMYNMKVNNQNLIVSVTPYVFDNIYWTILVVIDQDQVLSQVYLYSYISAGIAGTVLLLGLMGAIIISVLITQPLVNLKREFEKISRMDLDKVKRMSSLFSEISSIYRSLEGMVQWLKEFRAFLPENILDNDSDGDQKDNKLEVKIEASPEVRAASPGRRLSSAHSLSNGDPEAHRRMSTDSLSSVSVSRPGGGLAMRFTLGLTNKKISIIVVGFENLHALSHIMSPQDVLDMLQSALSKVNNIVRVAKGSIQVAQSLEKIYITFNATKDIRNHEVQALNTALDIYSALKSTNESFVREQHHALEFAISVSSGYALCGNVAMSNMKTFAVISKEVEKASLLQKYCHKLKCGILYNQGLQVFTKDKFITRPVDILRYNVELEEKEKVSVYELMGKIDTKGDEWMYEMENQAKAKRFENINKAFEKLLKPKTLSDLTNAQEQLTAYIKEKGESDLAARRLSSVIDAVIHQLYGSVGSEDSLEERKIEVNYSSTLGLTAQSFMSNKQIMLMHLNE